MTAIASPLDGALDMFERGFKVFPVKPNDKTPAVNGWQQWATDCTREKIVEYAARNPESNWGVAVYLNGHTAIDIDCKEGSNGFESLKAFAQQNKYPIPTLTVQTPSSGLHYYYKGICPSSVSKLADGIDIRGSGAYVVAPGSVVHGREYSIVEDAPIVDLPAWILGEINSSKGPTASSRIPEQIKVGKRNSTLTSIAGSMRRRGMCPEAIEAALLRVNEKQTEVPVPVSEVKRIVTSNQRYPQGQLPNVSESSMPAGGDFSPFCAADIIEAKIPRREWLMTERYALGFITVTISPGGIGKSALTMLEAVAVASGRNLTGFSVVSRGGVWIYNLEDNRQELERRMAAIAKHHKIDKDDLRNIYISSGQEQPLILASAQPREGVVSNEIAIVKLKEKIRQLGIRLLVLDPFVRAHGVNENDNMQVDRIVGILRQIATETQCAISVVHHSHKGGFETTDTPADANLARGASSLVSAARVVHNLNYCSKDDARKYGLNEEERTKYIYLQNTKSNLCASASKSAKWYTHRNVDLINGDQVGTMEPIMLEDKRGREANEAMERDRKTLGELLNRVYKTGMTLKEVLALVCNERIVMASIAGLETERRKEDRIRQLLSEPIIVQRSKFTLTIRPKRRPSVYIIREDDTDGTQTEFRQEGDGSKLTL